MDSAPLPTNEEHASRYDRLAELVLLKTAFRLAETDGEPLEVRLWEARYRLGLAERYAETARRLRTGDGGA